MQRAQGTLSAKIHSLYGNSGAQKAEVRALSDSSLELQGAHSPLAAPSTSRPASPSSISSYASRPASPASASRLAASSAAHTAAGAAPTTSASPPTYNPLAAAATAAPHPAQPFHFTGAMGLILERADMRDYQWLLSLLLQERSALGQPSARRQFYNPLAAAAASSSPATSAASAAPIRFTGAQGLIMEHADRREYERLLSLLLRKRSTLGRQSYNPLAAAAASPATAAAASAAPIRYTGAQGLIMERADMREYEWLLSLLLPERSAMALSSTATTSAATTTMDSGAVRTSTPTTRVTTTTASTTASSSPASTTAAASLASTTTTTTTSPTSSPTFTASPASSSPACITTTGPLFPVKATCHAPAPYVPLVYYMLAAATNASPYKLPHTVAVRA